MITEGIIKEFKSAARELKALPCGEIVEWMMKAKSDGEIDAEIASIGCDMVSAGAMMAQGVDRGSGSLKTAQELSQRIVRQFKPYAARIVRVTQSCSESAHKLGKPDGDIFRAIELAGQIICTVLQADQDTQDRPNLPIGDRETD